MFSILCDFLNTFIRMFDQIPGSRFARPGMTSWFIVYCFLFPFSLFANCLPHQTTPIVEITIPNWTYEIIQPREPMDLWHGSVIARMQNDFEISANKIETKNGACITLGAVHATIGYTDFRIQIDARHRQNSCEWDAILAHEKKHIDAYLSIIEDYESQIIAAIKTASAAAQPIFINSNLELSAALDALNYSVRNHPSVVLTLQKISAAQEIRNLRIDQNSRTREALVLCN